MRVVPPGSPRIARPLRTIEERLMLFDQATERQRRRRGSSQGNSRGIGAPVETSRNRARLNEMDTCCIRTPFDISCRSGERRDSRRYARTRARWSPGSPCASTSRRRKTMNFIERFFGVAPDGGSGLLELALLAAVAFLLALPLRHRVTRVVARFVRF